MDKSTLHQQLRDVVPPTKARSLIRMVGHALIELELITSIECAYDLCCMPSREFTVWFVGMSPQDRGQPTIDHVTELHEGGDDMPSNLRLIHFACNSKKSALQRFGTPEGRARIAEQNRQRWQDPTYRDKIIEAVTASQRRPEVRAAKSESMRHHWATEDHFKGQRP